MVEIQFTIAADGSVENLHTLAGHPLLAAAVTRAVSRWTFQPMRVNRRPAPLTTEMSVRFVLTP